MRDWRAVRKTETVYLENLKGLREGERRVKYGRLLLSEADFNFVREKLAEFKLVNEKDDIRVVIRMAFKLLTLLIKERET